MKRSFLSLVFIAMGLLVLFNFSWAQCPDDPTDRVASGYVYASSIVIPTLIRKHRDYKVPMQQRTLIGFRHKWMNIL